MQEMTRRAALKGTAAVASCAVATPALAAIRHDDAALMDLIGSFHRTYRATQKAPMHSPLAPAKMRAMSDVTQVLFAIEQGDLSAAEELLPLVYEELRKLLAFVGCYVLAGRRGCEGKMLKK